MKTTLTTTLIAIAHFAFSQCSFPVPVFAAANDTALIILSCPGEEISFDASNSLFLEGTELASLVWDFGDGVTDTLSWPIVNHTFENSGIYPVTLTLTDDTECTNLNTNAFLIMVSTTPNWTPLIDAEFCINDLVNSLENGLINTNLFNFTTDSLVSNVTFQSPEASLFIPDDQSICFESSILIENLDSLAIIDDTTTINFLHINMEHS